MNQLVKEVEARFKKKQLTDVRSGDVVRVHQRVKEGKKERVQVFEGLVIRTRRPKSLSFTITVRRIASGIGVEKNFLMNSPSVVKVEVVKRSDVRRKNLSYMRKRRGRSARLSAVAFDADEVNVPADFEKDMPKDEAEDTEPAQSGQPEADKKAEAEKDDVDKKDSAQKTEAKQEAKPPKKEEPKAKSTEKAAAAKADEDQSTASDKDAGNKPSNKPGGEDTKDSA